MNKSFLIANRNCGLGDILGNAALCWYLAKKSNSDLIVDWQKTVYNNYKTPVNLFSTIFNNESIDGVEVFEPCDFNNDYDIEIKNKFSNQYSKMMLKEYKFDELGQDFIAYNFLKKLNLNTSITSTIKNFYQKKLKGREILSVHFRYGDHDQFLFRGNRKQFRSLGFFEGDTKKNNIINCFKLYKKKIDKLLSFNSDLLVMIFTDCQYFAKLLSEEYECIDTLNSYPDNNQALHLTKENAFLKKINEAATCMFLMKNYSDFLICNQSNFNYFPRLFIPKFNQTILF